MIESKLTELLERAGERTNVGPPPIDAMRAGAARLRRRRTAAVSVVSAAAVVAVIGGTALATRPGTTPETPPPPAASTSPAPAPAEMRLVGLGHAAIAVPAAWGTNQTHCFTPHKDTVNFRRDPHLCAMPRPSGVESVDVIQGKPQVFDFAPDEIIEVDGVRAERRRTSCAEGSINRVTVCSGAVFIPSLDVLFWAESSTSAAEVDRILERVTIVRDRVGVPEFSGWTPDARTGAGYAAALTAAGLKPKIKPVKSPSYEPGEVLAVSPAPGTMLKPGATVTVTVTAKR